MKYDFKEIKKIVDEIQFYQRSIAIELEKLATALDHFRSENTRLQEELNNSNAERNVLDLRVKHLAGSDNGHRQIGRDIIEN